MNQEQTSNAGITTYLEFCWIVATHNLLIVLLHCKYDITAINIPKSVDSNLVIHIEIFIRFSFKKHKSYTICILNPTIIANYIMDENKFEKSICVDAL